MREDELLAMDIVSNLVEMRYPRGDRQAWQVWQSQTSNLTGALRALSRDQARQLADELWTRYDHEEILPFLGQLNTSIPGALAERSDELAAHGYILPSWLYLGAPASTTMHLIDMFDQPAFAPLRNGLLLALAWVGDESAQRQFRAWRENPPTWRSQLYIAPEEFTVDAGWELTPDYDRRELFYQSCYELNPIGESDDSDKTHGVASSTPTEAACGWCGRTLITLLDIDLRDKRCAFVISESEAPLATGTRLRIAHCLWCSSYATLYTDVDLSGGVSWSAENEAMPRILEQVGLGEDDEYELIASTTHQLALGAKRRTPFEAVGRFMLDETGISQLGGHPEWIQDASYPLCPSCHRHMPYIGQVSWEDLDELAEGSTYAFLCLSCGKAATVYQQT